jgi:SAM-dependent methyltransferase
MRHTFRTFRPDLALVHGVDHMFSGVVWSWVLPPEKSGAHLALFCGAQEAWRAKKACFFEQPHYGALFGEAPVLHRGDLYGSGPPVRIVSQEVLAFARTLQGPLLDFGCGAGALVDALREAGIDAYGIEMERPGLTRETLIGEVSGRISLYDGSFPLPFGNGQFASSVAVEVIEHIPNYPAALMELARVTRGRFVMTVPDMSSIPTLFPHGVVPWHLLEGTHYNFFNQTSLHDALRPLFRRIEFARIGPRNINGTEFFTSLVAFCTK